MKQEIWEALWQIWLYDEEYKQKSETKKRNRAVALEKGTPSFHGGSITITAHKKQLREKLGVKPSVRDVFVHCYSKKDGSLPPEARELVDKFDALVENATEEAEINGTVVNEEVLWIQATGGVSKGRVPFIGYESSSIRQQVSSYGMQDKPSDSIPQNVDHLKEEIRKEIASGLEKINTFVYDKLAHLEENVNEELGDRVKHVEDKVEEMCVVVDEVKSRAQENSTKLDIALEKIMASQNSFFANIKDFLKNSS